MAFLFRPAKVSIRAALNQAALAIVFATMLLAAAPDRAQAKDGPVRVDVELVLAVDISYSMDPEEQRLQRDGYVQALTSPNHRLKPTEEATILFSPRDRPWSTEWHRDWRDHVLDADFYGNIGDARWQEILADPDFFNQINCPLFEDTSTWFVPGSHLRVHNTDEEMTVYRSTTQEELRDETNRRTDEELELFCLHYCQAMPEAVQLVLNPGDFLLYRNTAWHIGNYVPYRERMTLHTHAMTPAFQEFAVRYHHLLKPREASLERHAKLKG